MRFAFVAVDQPFEMNCSVWRIFEPAKALAHLQDVGVLVLNADQYSDLNNREIRNAVGQADLIHIQRNIIMPGVLRATQYWMGAGKPVTLDLDDAYQMLPPTNPAHGFWIENSQGLDPPPLELVRKVLPDLDAFTTPSKLLLEDWKPYYKRGIWWPNYPTSAWYEGLKKEPHEGFIIGWGGSSSHWDSWWFTPAAEALKRVYELRPQVKVRICGADRRIFDILPLPEDRKEYVGFAKPDDWPRNLAQFDLGIAPLAEEYDQRRSWIKGVECMLARVPWIGTEGWPYQDLAQWGTLVPNTVDAWVAAIIDHVDHPRDTMPGYLAALDLTLERRAPDLLRMLASVVATKKARRGEVGIRDVVYA